MTYLLLVVSLSNYGGRPLVVGTKLFGNLNTLMVEPTALKMGLIHATLAGYQRIIMEDDSKILINCLLRRCLIPWRIRTISKDVVNFTSVFSSISFHHILRG